MYGLQYRESLPQAVRDELEALLAAFNAKLLREHRNDGRHLLGFWEPYPIHWSMTTSPPAVGNGSLQGRYMRIGNTVFVSIRLRIGSTTTVGTGDFVFSLPVPAARTETVQWAGSATTTNGSGTTVATRTGIIVVDTVGNPFSDSNPGSWPAGYQLYLTVMYEAADETD